MSARRLQAATATAQRAARELRAARVACVHWDYESDGDGHTCCAAVAARYFN